MTIRPIPSPTESNPTARSESASGSASVSDSGSGSVSDSASAPAPSTPLSTGFRALDLALEAAALVIATCQRVRGPLRPLADQALRAATSVPLNLTEGNGRAGGDRLYHFRVAYGSAREATAAIGLLAASRSIPQADAAKALDLLDQVQALTWRLTHPRT